MERKIIDVSNRTSKGESLMAKVEFVEYTGRYPNLCSGRLFVLIDKRMTSFGNYCLGERGRTSDEGVPNYPEFWQSGGWVKFYDDWEEDVGEGPWEIRGNIKDYPEDIQRLLPELIRIFNENVPWGCCGGCV